MKRFFAPTAIALVLVACSPNSTGAPTKGEEAAVTNTAAPAEPTLPSDTPTAQPGNVIGLEGLGDLKIGQPIPAKSSWAPRGAQTLDACQTVTSPLYPGVYAIVTGGKVRRITVGKQSTVKLVEGIGAGSSEADVGKWFAGFRAEPHKYEAAPAKYLTAPNAASGDPAVRFEIGQDGKVSLIHVGTMPELAYVEGCS